MVRQENSEHASGASVDDAITLWFGYAEMADCRIVDDGTMSGNAMVAATLKRDARGGVS